MNENNPPGAAGGPKDDTVAPVGVAQPAKVERLQTDELIKTEENAAEMEKATKPDQKAVPPSAVRFPPD